MGGGGGDGRVGERVVDVCLYVCVLLIQRLYRAAAAASAGGLCAAAEFYVFGDLVASVFLIELMFGTDYVNISSTFRCFTPIACVPV